MTLLIRFLVLHALIGFGLAGLLLAALLGFDVAGLRTLLAGSDSGLLAAGLLFFFLGLTFGSAQMGFAIMLLAEDDKGDGAGRKRRQATLLARLAWPKGALKPAPVRARG